jgi:hypothetical protein
MKDSDLDKKLRAVRVPERSEEYWDAFPRTVLGRLSRDEERTERHPRSAGIPWLLRGLGTAFACMAVVITIGYWRNRALQAESFALLQNAKVLHEVRTLFPNRVRAIVNDDQGLRLVLSDQPDVPDSTAFVIKICEGSKCRTVVTFSGQDLQIAGETVEVLADAQGRVMLVGDRLFWSERQTKLASNHLRIQARPLSDVL